MTDVRLVEFLGRGGLVQYAYQFTRGLRENGVDAALVTAHGSEVAPLAGRDEVVPLFRTWDPIAAAPVSGRVRRAGRVALRAGHFALEWLRLLRYLERERPRWVQFGEVLTPLELPFLALLHARGFLLADVCHNVQPFDWDPDSPHLRKGGAARAALYGRIYRLFDLVFVHNAWSRREFLRLYHADPARVATIPLGNMSLFRSRAPADPAALRARLGLPPDAPVALFFGALAKYKGVEDLVRAFPRVLARVPDAHLVIAGYPRIDLAALAGESAALGITERVHVWPAYIPTEDVPALMALARVAVYPYRSIDQSAALQVAYTFGVPVVATAVGGLPEVVEHGESGVLVPPGDGDALAGAVADLLADPARAARYGARARALSETRFAWREVGRQAAQQYRRREAEISRPAGGHAVRSDAAPG